MQRRVKTKLTQTSGAFLLIFLCWLVYSSSYLGKVNYSANITQIMEFYGVTKAQAGMVPTFFFFAYGIGQVFNGLYCKKYNIKWIVFFSLVTSALINFTIGITTNFAIIKWLWLINGFVLAILWPTLIRLLSESLPQKSLGTSSVVMGTTVAVGTMVIYALSSLFVAFDVFKLAFYTAGATVFVVAVIWLIVFKKAESSAKTLMYNEEKRPEVQTEKTAKNQLEGNEKRVFFMVVCILCFFAVGVNLIKDGLTTWVPAILKEEFAMSDSLSVLLTLLLPIIAIFANAFALNMHKKIPDYINQCVIVFALIAVLVGIIIGSLTLKIAVVMLIALVCVNFFASTLNSLITSIFPLFAREKIESGKIAGILNGFCYLGSTISAYGLGVIADNFGWAYVFWTLIGFCFISFIVWIVYKLAKKI